MMQKMMMVGVRTCKILLISWRNYGITMGWISTHLQIAAIHLYIISALSTTPSDFQDAVFWDCYSFPNPSSFPFPNDLRRNPLNIKTIARAIATTVLAMEM
jgi:hypothetical protein